MNFHTFPAVLFISRRSSCLLSPSYSLHQWYRGTVPFVGSKPQAALWSCEKQRHTSFLWIGCTYMRSMCLFTQLRRCVWKKVLCWFAYFLLSPFPWNTRQTWCDNLFRADLICIFLSGFMRKTLSDSCMKACVCVLGWHTLSRGRPLGTCSVPTD